MSYEHLERGGTVCGLPMKEYIELIDHFNAMNINLLYVKSSFAGGGLNLTMPYFMQFTDKKGCIIARHQKPNFTIILGSITNRTTIHWEAGQSYGYPFNPRANENFNLNKFFNCTLNKKNYSDEELKKMLQPITSRSKKTFTEKKGFVQAPYISEMPKVCFPGAEDFSLLALDEKVGILTEEEAKKHQRENTEIFFKQKDVVALYPSEIEAPMRIEKGDLFCFGITIMEPGCSLTKINKLSVDCSFNELLFALAFGQGADSKCIYIHSLITRDREFINVFLHIGGDYLDLLYTDEKNQVVYDAFYASGYALKRVEGRSKLLERVDKPATTFKSASDIYNKMTKCVGGEFRKFINDYVLLPFFLCSCTFVLT